MKPIYQSKTFWFNLLTILVSVAAVFGFQAYQPDAQMTEITTIIVGIVNIILRLYTSQPIGNPETPAE